MLHFLKLVDTVSEWIGKGTAPLLIVMMLIGVYEVAARDIFDRPTVWAWELDRYLLLVVVALAGAYTLLHQGHVSVDIVYARLPPRFRVILDEVLFLLCFAPLMIVLFWQSIDYTCESIALGETSYSSWRPIIYPVKAVLPVAFLLMLLQGLSLFIHNIPSVFSNRRTSR